MSNVNLPTPVAVAAGVLCLLGGYLVGVVLGPDTPSRTTAQVESYDSVTGELCLVGDAIYDQGVKIKNGDLCGTWLRSSGSITPVEGDSFRFVAIVNKDSGQSPSVTFYGDVVDR